MRQRQIHPTAMAMFPRQRGSPARGGYTFYRVVFAMTVLVAISFFVNSRDHASSSPLGRRDTSSLAMGKRDEECRFVHSAVDQCAFIRANCADEEAGLFSYLQLYYCKLGSVKPVAFIIMVTWLALLFSTIGIAASDFLCINLSTIATLLGMSESLAGVTFLAFGNGSPDVFSTFAAFSSNSGSLAIGELIGAACFISAVVAGSMAIVRPFKVARKSFIRDVAFFAVAAGFSMSFLADGELHLWECGVMVGFYVFYVIFVVSWHWYLKRSRERKLREAAARTHYHIPGNQELEVEISDDEDEPMANETETLGRGGHHDDFSALEAGPAPAWKIEEADDDEEARDQALAELRSQMRVSRPPRGERRPTITPIRPSLVGALEFRSVLNNLQRSRSHITVPLSVRRHSHDASLLDEQSRVSGAPETYGQSAEDLTYTQYGNIKAGVRGRAVSANDAQGLKIDTNILNENANKSMHFLEVPVETPLPMDHTDGTQKSDSLHPSPTISVTRSRASSKSQPRPRSPGLLEVPEDLFLRPSSQGHLAPGNDSPAESPRSRGRRSTNKSIPRSPLGHQSPATFFPPYSDSPVSTRPPSLHLDLPHIPVSSPPPSSSHPDSLNSEGLDFARYSWWPYEHLPPPQRIMSTIFPTIYHWHSKSLTEKLLGIVTAPSVFLLTITLPVVEDSQDIVDPDPGLLSPRPGNQSRRSTAVLPPESPVISVLTESGTLAPTPQIEPSPALEPSSLESSPKEWNRWLVILQIFTAPFFLVVILWANIDETQSPMNLFYYTLCSLLFSLVSLLIVLVLTKPDRRPKYHSLLCFLGFLVAIGWIATIANEVVGVLKAVGVILGMSDAILGLTIFAVGNSLGDLVADITVARLGYPVMALSACFGGPMLNILLGIGVSGLYMTITNGNYKHKKHPDRPVKYKPYTIDVSTTLIISGVTLLVTLIGLLILVPLNGWYMDRRIGVGLIILWTVSTIGNVVVEITGAGESVS